MTATSSTAAHQDEIQPEAITRGVLESISDDKLVLHIPGTDYRLHLVPGVPASALAGRTGRRVRGVIDGDALRIHAMSPNTAGGRFIEPVIGPPRILAGRIAAADRLRNHVVVDVAVPMRLRPLPEQDWSILEPGRMVNLYIESGTTFTPVEE